MVFYRTFSQKHMTQIDHINCFPLQRNDTSLPHPVDGQRVIDAIVTGMRIMENTINQYFSRDNASQIGRNQKNAEKLRGLGQSLLMHFNPAKEDRTIRTFGQLQKAYENARRLVRDAIGNHPEYKNRQMDPIIKEEVAKVFIATCKRIHAEIDKDLRANASAAEEKARSDRLILLRRVSMETMTKNVTLIAPQETVDKNSADLFVEFLLCVEEALQSASQKGATLQRTTLEATVQSYCEGNDDQTALFMQWTQQLLPASITIPAQCGSEEVRGETEIHAPHLLMPRKMRCLDARTDPMGLPNWTLTPEELSLLRTLTTARGDGRDENALAVDDTFLSLAAQSINERCSGGMSVVRGAVEVQAALRALAKEKQEQASAAHNRQTSNNGAPVPQPGTGESHPPMESASAARPLSELHYLQWGTSEIQQFLRELRQEQSRTRRGARGRKSAEYKLPPGKCETWEEEYAAFLSAMQ